MTTALILIVDDEPSIRTAVATLLRSRGYAVTTAATAADALQRLAEQPPALVIVDLGLPDMDGAALCARIRERGSMPIVVLSVRNEERTKVQALDAGADDYVTKPFGPDELVARIRAALRRAGGEALQRHGRVRAAELTLDFDRRRVYRGGDDLRLTPREFDLLTLLAGQPGRVVTHKRIVQALWGVAGANQQEHLRVLVGQLRRKLELDPAHPRYVITEPWVGYRFADDTSV